ncbi:hypothetical protein KEI63_004134 [Salmonella enterica]|nr:hypothetical protein [Salmonella enterica]ECL0572293.1 hypothetical protein [Salmonella enterica]EHL7332271.1 hypothetical protein [Salmonella enterica]EHL7350985.1 hypothetical protein [Salmonella enterica]EHL7355493.1 hypothetical protein [Salmonella enterica]
MVKKYFKHSGVALLALMITGKIVHAAPGGIIAQTTEPSVGHRTNTSSFDHVYGYNGEKTPSLKSIPLPGFMITVAARNHILDIDNDSYGAGENINNYRSIYRIDSSGKETAVETNTPVSIKGEPYYTVTDSDINYRLKIQYVRRSSSTSYTPLPSESYPQNVITEVVSSPLVPVSPILYVNGIERTDYTMYPDEIGYLRYQVVNRDKQPIGNINIRDWGGSVVSSSNGTIRMEASTINVNGEVERKITTHSGSSNGTVTFPSVGASYNGYALWPMNISITMRPRP